MNFSKISKPIIIVALALVIIFLESNFSVISKLSKFIFIKSKIELVDTPSIIQKVIGINQIVSSEYCSETYCSLDDKPVFELDYYIQEGKADNLYLYNCKLPLIRTV